jgi:hypothetical protein
MGERGGRTFPLQRRVESPSAALGRRWWHGSQLGETTIERLPVHLRPMPPYDGVAVVLYETLAKEIGGDEQALVAPA